MTKPIQTIEWLSDNSAFFSPSVTAHDAACLMGAYEPKYPLPCIQLRVRIKSREVIVYDLARAPRHRVVRYWGKR